MKTISDRPNRSFSLPATNEIVSSLVSGIVIGILIIFLEVSFAAMVFSGELQGALPHGIGFYLLGSLIMGLVLTFASSFVPIIAIPQDSPTAIIATITVAIIARLAGNDPGHVFNTVVSLLLFSSVFTGIFFWLMGRFNLGRLVRFIPYPVVGGFLGGTGWILVLGGVGVMTEAPLGLQLFQWEILLRWLPGVLFAVVLFVMLRRFEHFLVMPALLVSGVLLFYLVYYLSTGSLASAGQSGWLLGPFPEGGLLRFMALRIFFGPHQFTILWDTMVNFGSIIVISTISLLLNASGLELIAGEDRDLNRELKVTGIANIIAGLGGSPPGYHTLSLSALGKKLGANSRLVGVFAFSIIGITLFFGASTLSIFPRMIAGSLLIYLGISFLYEWVFEAWFKLPKLDYFLIWLILIIIASVGFLEGVAVGIVVAVLLFVVNYSRVNVIRHAISGANFPSYVVRPRLYDQLLRQRGDSIYTLELQGYIFFGSADRLVKHIRERIEDTSLPQLRYLLLDFRLVTGIDSSTALSFTKLNHLTKNHEITLVFTKISEEYLDILGEELRKELIIFENLDQGIIWCEEKMIEVFTEVGLVAKPKTILQIIEDSLTPETEEQDWLETLIPGSKQEPSKRASRLLKYLTLIDADDGEYLINENHEIEGLYFIENGQVREFASRDDGTKVVLSMLETGTAFGTIDHTAENIASTNYVTNEPCKLYFLSLENMKRMEEEDPQLALVLHRILAGTRTRYSLWQI